MRMYDIIMRKRNGKALREEEIRFFIEGFTRGDIPDYQAAALLMAIFLNGMDDRETAQLTDCMARSGDMVDLSPIPGIKVDKHSTGGVGDKTSLIVAPIVAACGVKVAKMSGRGLGHTGGTVDKLESIPGFVAAIEKERFFSIVNETGLAIIGQSGNIAPADKKLYALRDVTATVDNMSLIASSIMSKKLAAGADAILLDVKTGSGAFMKTLEESVALARAMVNIGVRTGRRTVALITNMDAPLGNAIGNSLEIVEAVNTLKGKGPADLTAVCMELASGMLELAGVAQPQERSGLVQRAVRSGEAFRRLVEMVKAQGGDVSVLEDTGKFPKAPVEECITACKSGYITHLDAEACGAASVALGAGRARKEDEIDHSAGIILLRKSGEKVREGEPIAQLYTSGRDKLLEARRILSGAVSIEEKSCAAQKLVLARVAADGVEYLQ